MRSHFPRSIACAVAALLILFVSGCATTQSTRAKGLKSTGDIASVSNCVHLTVISFGIPDDGKAPESVGISLAADIAGRLRIDFGSLFEDVVIAGEARGMQGECLLEGDITYYRAGSRIVRLVLIPGIGRASLEGNIRIVDAASGRELLVAPFDKLWAFSGLSGFSKGIDDMLKETAASAASTVARAKGWQPPPRPSGGNR